MAIKIWLSKYTYDSPPKLPDRRIKLTNRKKAFLYNSTAILLDTCKTEMVLVLFRRISEGSSAILGIYTRTSNFIATSGSLHHYSKKHDLVPLSYTSASNAQLLALSLA